MIFGFDAQGLAVIIAAIGTACASVAAAIFSAKANMKAATLDTKVTTRNGQGVGSQVDDLTTYATLAIPADARTKDQIAHLDAVPPTSLLPASDPAATASKENGIKT
jgi:hypothetical protein